MSLTKNNSLRTAVLIASLIISLGAILNSVYSVTYGVKENQREIIRVEKKLDGSHTESNVKNKELESKIGEVRDKALVNESYNRITDINTESIKVLSRDLGEIKGGVEILISRSN